MKELINEAENIRAKLLEVMLNIPYDFEPDYTIAITQTADFLKKLIDRKDNIVDLGEIWHNNKDIPHKDRKIIAVSCNEILCGTFMVEAGWYRANINSVKVLASWESIKKWAYVEDLLPRGGEA